MTRIYLPLDLAVGARVDLPEEAIRHLVQVLRMQVGEQLTVFNGQGGEYFARIASASRKAAAIELLSFEDVSREPPMRVTIAQCVSKGDRMDYALQKCTELGAHAFIPVISSRCNVKLDGERWEKKMEHWQGVIVSAAEQSGRTAIPSIASPVEFSALQLENPLTLHLLLSLEGSKLSDLCGALQGSSVQLLAGPEGGFTGAELSSAIRTGWQPVRLGDTVLRTETAPVAALSALLF